MRISDLELFLVNPPRDDGVARPASLIVRLSTVSGAEGWGEADVRWRPSELTPRRDALLPVLAGRSVFDIEELLRLDALRPAPLRAALEMACWDCVGRIAGQPLCHLWGGRYRSRVPLAASLSASEPEALARRARELAAEGYYTQIVGAFGDVEVDRANIAAVRDAVGESVALWLDAEQLFGRQSARELCNDLEAERVQAIIDPLATRDWQEWGNLARETSTPLAVGKGATSAADVLAIARHQAATMVVLCSDRVGGLSAVRQSALVAETCGLDPVLGGRTPLGLGLAAVVHLAAATPALGNASESAHFDLSGDILARRLEIVDGLITLPEGPGLGVEVDRARLDRYQVT
ncbi:MAG: mandelate racemase/muconate lactonizing enzyme family protein [Pirellulales bacterium]